MKFWWTLFQIGLLVLVWRPISSVHEIERLVGSEVRPHHFHRHHPHPLAHPNSGAWACGSQDASARVGDFLFGSGPLQLPYMLFHGMPGIRKTTIALAIVYGSTGTLLLCIVFFGFVFILFASVCISSDTYTSTVHLLKCKYKHGALCNGQVNCYWYLILICFIKLGVNFCWMLSMVKL